MLKLRHQLEEMEHKKQDYEKRFKEYDQILKHKDVELELERTEKSRLESTNMDLNSELKGIRGRIVSLENERDSLNQRYVNLQTERVHHGRDSLSKRFLSRICVPV